MRLYQKQVERKLNKEYGIPFEDFLTELRAIIPGNVEIIKIETVKEPKFGEIEVYNVFNTYSDDLGEIPEDEWNKKYDVFIEFWKVNTKNGKYVIQ